MTSPPEPHDLSRLRIERQRPTRRQQPKSRLRRALGMSLVLALVLGLGFGGYRIFESLRSTGLRVQTVVVTKTNPTADSEATSASGYVTARTHASVASPIQGRLVKLLVDTGMKVEKDQVLAEIQHEQLDAILAGARAERERLAAQVEVEVMAEVQAQKALASAQAAIEEAVAAVAETKVSLDEAERRFVRDEALFAQGNTSVEALDKSRTERDVAAARARLTAAKERTSRMEAERLEAEREWAARRLEAARKALGPADANIEGARASLDLAIIRAPFSGVILRKDAEVGEVVSPAAFGGSGSKTAIVTMADFGSLEFEVDVSEKYIGVIKEGMPCQVVLDAFKEKPMLGKVRRIEPTANRQNATILVKISFTEPDARMVPEMGGRAVFLNEGGEKTAREAERVFVRSAAVVTRDGRRGVFVVDGGKVGFMPIDVGSERGGEMVVLKGLRGGERVVVAPPEGLAEGQRVEF